jgi:hypothetical protein
MSLHAPGREACRKSGAILTCYVDGHKRFRVVPLFSIPDSTPPDEDLSSVETPLAAGRPGVFDSDRTLPN